MVPSIADFNRQKFQWTCMTIRSTSQKNKPAATGQKSKDKRNRAPRRVCRTFIPKRGQSRILIYHLCAPFSRLQRYSSFAHQTDKTKKCFLKSKRFRSFAHYL